MLYEIRLHGNHFVDVTDAELHELHATRRISRDTPCKPSGQGAWSTAGNLVPLLKYSVTPTGLGLSRFDPSSGSSLGSAAPVPKPSPLSITKAGWICVLLGLLTFWVFGLGMIFLGAAFILSIVAMSTGYAREGLRLLCGTVASYALIIGLCFLFGMSLIGGLLTGAWSLATSNSPHGRRVDPLAASTPRLSAQPFAFPSPKPNVLVADPEAQRIVENYVNRSVFEPVTEGEREVGRINGQLVKVGQEIVLPNGEHLRVSHISDNAVLVVWKSRTYWIRKKARAR